MAQAMNTEAYIETVDPGVDPVEKSRFLYIGRTAWYKNISFLESLVEKLPEKYFSWMGGSQRLKNINGLGKLDFSNVEHIISSKNSIF